MQIKLTTIAALAAAGLLAGARLASADTINVHSSPNNSSSVSLVGSGPFTGDDAYVYDISFDASANVIAPGNGFMVIDFGLLAGYTLTGPAGAAATLAGEFTESTQVAGAGLSGYTGNSAGVDHFRDPTSGNTSSPTDIVTEDNAVFFYNGGTPFTSGSVDLTLTLFTVSTSPPLVGNGFGVDSSGVANSLSFSLNSVLVPSAPAAVPVPVSLISGLTLIGLVGLGRFMKVRRIEA